MDNRIMALDVGDKRIGLAISDLMGWTAQPLYTLHRTCEQEDLQKIKKTVLEYKPKVIVIGLPKNMDGSIGFQGDKTMEFAEKLKNILSEDIPIVFQDERLTTKSARNVMNMAGTKKKNKKNMVDTIAAVFILETYLMKNG